MCASPILPHRQNSTAGMKILVVGSGGREHALAWKLAQSKKAEAIFVAPGNGGTARGINKVSNIDIGVEDFAALADFARNTGIDLVVPGPEAPLVNGIEKWFRNIGIPVFGPSKEAARMEGSKAFSKDFMQRHQIPTAEFQNFSDYSDARAYLDSVNHPVVIKASGLAAGKGVIIPTSKEEAHGALKEIMLEKEFGSAGDEVVIEELLEGDELSVLSFSDGYTIVSLPPAQDHKRIHDGDKGPNTGGMGCYAPTRIASKAVIDTIHRTILQPTIDGMRREGYPFKGVLFTGLMMTKSGPKVLEYNVRFGDPETQTVLPLLSEDTDLASVMLAAAEGYLDGVSFNIKNEFSATVVASAGGYPGSYSKGQPMTIDNVDNGIQIFHAGTALANGTLKTAGGRVIAASATAKTLEDAVKLVYEGIVAIHFDGMYYRKDIAYRAFRQAFAPSEALTYASAGVSVDNGNAFVERIKTAVRSTRIPGADGEIGGFGGMFDLKAANLCSCGLKLVAGTDGVGTKLNIARDMGQHREVGIDLVAMSVNDLLAQGAQPFMFLDYFSIGKLDVELAAGFVEGVAEGCKAAGCALVGGETAEMPGMYAPGDYDAAGTAVGAVRDETLLPKLSDMAEGDILIGLQSNGVHSNGYSLVRKIIEREGLKWDEPAPWNNTDTIGSQLLRETRIYVKPIMKLVHRGLIKGLSHITGGGLTENIPRMLPSQLAAEVDVSSWKLSALFSWLKKAGNISAKEFARTWNTGIGMVLVVSPQAQADVLSSLANDGEKAFVVGKLVSRANEGCILKNIDVWDT